MRKEYTSQQYGLLLSINYGPVFRVQAPVTL